MILRGHKQLEGRKGFHQNEHLHYGKNEVIEKEVPTSSNEDVGDGTCNKILDDPRKSPQNPIYLLYRSPYEWLRLNLTNNLGSSSKSLGNYTLTFHSLMPCLKCLPMLNF